jgi:hypothetical protein
MGACVSIMMQLAVSAERKLLVLNLCRDFLSNIFRKYGLSSNICGGETPVFVDKQQTSFPNPMLLVLGIQGIEAKDTRPTLAAARPGTAEYPTL